MGVAYGKKIQKIVSHAMKKQPLKIVIVRVVFGLMKCVYLAVQEVQVRMNAIPMGVCGRGKNVFRVAKCLLKKSAENQVAHGTQIQKCVVVTLLKYYTE